MGGAGTVLAVVARFVSRFVARVSEPFDRHRLVVVGEAKAAFGEGGGVSIWLAFSGLYCLYIKTLPGGTGTSMAECWHAKKDQLGTGSDSLGGWKECPGGMGISHAPRRHWHTCA